MTDEDARTQIEVVREFYWPLSCNGFEYREGEGYRELHHNERLRMTEAPEVRQFILARAFLSYFKDQRISRANPRSTAEWSKLAEDWSGGLVRSGPISHGMFVAAALALGFTVRQTPGTPHGTLNLSERAWSAAKSDVDRLRAERVKGEAA